VLEVAGLRSAYGRIEVLRGIDLTVRDGEIVALVGSNGAGKTTLLRALSGVQPVSAGRVLLQAIPSTERPRIAASHSAWRTFPRAARFSRR
jgi:branched-chain amino acid transport system ATP-binding protein